MFYLTINGKYEGILLACSNGKMRVALDGSTDVVELRECEGQWTLEDGTLVELDGLFTDGAADVTLFSELYPRALSAGAAEYADTLEPSRYS